MCVFLRARGGVCGGVGDCAQVLRHYLHVLNCYEIGIWQRVPTECERACRCKWRSNLVRRQLKGVRLQSLRTLTIFPFLLYLSWQSVMLGRGRLQMKDVTQRPDELAAILLIYLPSIWINFKAEIYSSGWWAGWCFMMWLNENATVESSKKYVSSPTIFSSM